MKLNKFLIPILVIAGFAIYLSLFVVKEINQAIVLQFGDPKKVIVKPIIMTTGSKNLFNFINC